MDLGSGVVSCGILTTITLVDAWNSIWYVIASVMPAYTGEQLIPDHTRGDLDDPCATFAV